MIKEQFFPTTIYAKDVELDNDLFTREVVRWSNEDKGIKRTNMNGWHSHTDMHKIPVFKPLVDELFKMQFEVFNEEHLAREPIIGNMWANINPPGGYNRPHIHPNSHFSGVYYIKATKDSGDIVFNDPSLNSFFSLDHILISRILCLATFSIDALPNLASSKSI